MDSKLLNLIVKYHENGDHEKIIELISDIPEKERDYEALSLLARAYNNLGGYDKALETLLRLKDEGKGDHIYHFRLGYAYFYLGREAEALEEFQKSGALCPADEDTLDFIEQCRLTVKEEEALYDKKGVLRMDKDMMKIVDKYNEDNRHLSIIRLISSIPQGLWDYDAKCLLARAYNNAGEYEKALELLLPLKKEGENDLLYHFRLGYSYFYLDREAESLEEFRKSDALNPGDEDTLQFIKWCEEILAKKFSGASEVYSQEELDTLEAHIQKYFGEFSKIFHETVSEDIHLDVAIIEPSDKRDHYVLVTMGAGAYKMNVPKEMKDKSPRAEFMIALPKDWNMEDEAEKWPVGLLKNVGRIGINDDTWVGFGHSVSYEFCLGETAFCGALLSYPLVNEQKHMPVPLPGDWNISECSLPGGDRVDFFQIIPIYREEIDYKIKAGAEELFRKLTGVSPVVDIDRENRCATGKLEAEDFKDDIRGRAGYATVCGTGGVFVSMYRAEGEGILEPMEELLPAVKNHIKWLEENTTIIKEALKEAGAAGIAEERLRGYEKLKDENGRVYCLIDGGKRAGYPVIEEDFLASVKVYGISLGFSGTKIEESYIYAVTEPNYFDGNYFILFLDRDGSVNFEGLSDLDGEEDMEE